MHATSFAILASCVSQALAATYALSDCYVGAAFLAAWQHQAIPDPTNGRVNYVDQATALAKNLTFVSDDSLILRADDTTVLDPNGPGRDSVRIQSVKAYTTHVVIIDVRHMPQGCSTWPAFWESDVPNWPNGGEVDIVSLHFVRDVLTIRELNIAATFSRISALSIEGVNDVTPNSMTLHTGSNCSMPANRTETGTPTALDCDVNTDNNSGCGAHAPTADSYGPPLNAIGGGWYAMERTNDFISVWFFPRNRATPFDVSSGALLVDTDHWGTPTAFFPNTDCDIDSQFDANNIIINLTFCGDWAGIASVYSGAGCPGDCVDFVNNNPASFADAYWDIAAVRVYESGGSLLRHRGMTDRLHRRSKFY
ncbi:glycoside hydrolase family 16 protein [Phanerochaete carnosa HHB-10118-sp]|uniref:Glycoside hydrolase family 16 protein n=1 Tax=Phanerochaete carnosa (strain HHB-10118-sp) TaxID=650164 RepID=K5W5N8_PHACS|nr:glycoside hydrolase family 16 protein [Phanerochaete carnosa HHB-10118-sp]EKM54269.1 glycoside hydrolase family 16 protein [Phanerochaete carnosa HHB-10118-sp]